MDSDLKTYVLEHVSPEAYYKARFGHEFNPKVRSNVKCVFHTDRKPSLAINLQNGGAKCFAASCGQSIGNIVHFESVAGKISEADASSRLYSEFIRPTVSSDYVEELHDTLLSDSKLRVTFTRTTGINVGSIEHFQIGYDQRTRRYTFPIQNQFGQTVNIRFYRPKSLRKKDDVKIYSYVRDKGKETEVRYGGIELFPWTSFPQYTASKPLFIMASEKETILAIQLGLQAVCSTNGEGSWLPEWTELFTGMDLCVLFDPDKGGMKAAEKIVATLQSVASNITSLTLPFPDTYRGDRDFDDWINTKSGTQYKLLQIVQDTFNEIPVEVSASQSPSLESVPGSLATPKLFDNEVHDIAEVQERKDMMNNSVKIRGIIAAVATKTYDIPWKFEAKVKGNPKKQIITVPAGREIISFVGRDDSDVKKNLSTITGTVISEASVVDWITIFEAEIVPIADISSDLEGRYTIQRCFCIGSRIESNVPYELTVIPTTLTATQEKVFIIVGSQEISRAIDTWIFDEKQWSEFEIFQPSEGQSVTEKLRELAEELSVNHTKIYCRPDWHTIALLSYFCPIGFYFPGEPELQRGWLNTLAIGDTQTGKSKVTQVLQRLLRLGDIINAENCTFVGLVGGAIKTGSGQMMLRWGRIPLCDRKLVIIEEFSGLSVTEISHMSEVRSRGIARLDKGGLSSQTPARTRLIVLSNVRPMNKTLAQYLSGVKALQELIGHAEDISRFDLIVTLIDSEVSSETINSPSDESTPATFTVDQLQRLCQFVWALKPEKIRFADEAYIACLEWTQKMQAIYHPSVPIFKAASGRLLLARIACAIATLQFSWDGAMLSVESTHVDAAVKLLRSLYDKPSFGYLEYSKQMQDRESIKDVETLTNTIRTALKSDLVAQTFDSLIHSAKFSRDELAAVGSMQIFQADDLIGAMLRSRVLRKGDANVWEITKVGKVWMQEQIELSKNGSRKPRMRKV